MATNLEYIEGLRWKLGNLKKEIAQLQGQIQELYRTVDAKRRQAERLMELLGAEGEDVRDAEKTSLDSVAIGETAFELLISQVKKSPMHYEDMAAALIAKGILIPGRNPAANLLAHIARDKRFVRTSRGTYGLAEWGIPAMKSRSKRARRRHKWQF